MSLLQAGQDAPDFILPNLQGESVQLSAWRGTPVLLNFYKSNCPWCQIEMPRLAEVYRRLQHVNVKVLGVAVGGDDATSAARFAEEKQLGFPVVIDSEKTARESYQLQRVPTFVLIDGEGKIACVYEGATEQLSGIIEQTILAVAGRHELPEYSLVGNGCAPEG